MCKAWRLVEKRIQGLILCQRGMKRTRMIERWDS